MVYAFGFATEGKHKSFGGVESGRSTNNISTGLDMQSVW